MTDSGPHAPSIYISVVGWVESPLKELGDAPRQADEGAPAAWLVFDPAVAGALVGLKPGDDIVVVTWLDRARRDVLSVHPRGDASRAPQGVFSTRSPHRPNPIGLHEVKVTALEGPRVRVDRIEAIDGTACHRCEGCAERRWHAAMKRAYTDGHGQGHVYGKGWGEGAGGLSVRTS